MNVRIYPEGTSEAIGAERWVVRWYTRRKGTEHVEDVGPEHLEWNLKPCKTRLAAVRTANKVAPLSEFGEAELQRQVVEWLGEVDNVGEWVDVGEPETIR